MSVKIVALIRARPELSREEFLHYWQGEHPAVVWALPGLRAYHQNPAIDHRRPWPWDGLAELWFDSVADVRRAFDSPEAGPMREHEKRFIESMEWFIATTTETSREDGTGTPAGDRPPPTPA